MPRSDRAPGIFISYRRDDTAGFAGRLYDRLAARFGATHVFMDIDTIHPGHEFAADIEQALYACDACIVLIGRQWGSITLPDGSRRLDDPTDFVRLEVAAAIRRGIAVFPVLVDGAKPPAAGSLPVDIRAVAGRQAIELSNERWNYDVGRLILALEQLDEPPPEREPPRRRTPKPSRRWRVMIAGTAGLVLLAGFLVWRTHGGLDACPSAPPSLQPSASVAGIGTGTYTVDLTPVCQTGQPGSENKVWSGEGLGVVDPTFSPETWTFSPTGASQVLWVFPERSATATLSPYAGGGYEATSLRTAHACGSPGSVGVTRELYVSPSDPNATSFDGLLRIFWECGGPFEVRFHVTGTRNPS